MSETGSRFCARCGRPLVAGAAFCAGCGAPVAPSGPPPAPPPGAQQGAPPRGGRPAATTIAGTAQRTMMMASRGAMVGGMIMSTPWTTLVAGQGNLGELAKRWAPSIVGMLPRPSLRIPALSLLFSVSLDLFAAFVSGQPAAMQMAGLRAGLGVLTALFGLMVGRRGGFLRYVTTGLSAITTLVMLASVGRLLFAAPSNPAGWLPLIPTLVCQVASVVAVVKTVMLAVKKHA